jgi:HlyD family secretion protein
MHQQVARPQIVRRKRRKWKAWVLSLMALLGIGGGAYFFQTRERVIPVTTEKAAIRDLTQLVSATGKIRPEVEVKISPEVAGEIIELPVVDGQAVKKGDLLVKIRPDDYIARVKQAEAALSAAQADSLQRKAQMLNDGLDLGRARNLFDKHLISETDFKAAETKSQVSTATYESSLHQIDVARSSLEQSKVLLDKTVIYAPMTGTVSALSSELGERVVATGDFAGTEVMRVADMDSMEARVDVNENDVVNVRIGDPVRIQVDAYPGKQFQGTVKRIASTATVKNEGTQQEVTNFEVRVQINHPQYRLRPGMSASVDIETQTVKNVVSVPIQSITVRSRESGETLEQMKQDRAKDMRGVSSADAEMQDRKRLERVVFLKQGDVAKLVPVQTKIADNYYIQILSGITAGDEVISGPYSAISKDLKDGSKVKIEKPKGAAQ